MTYEDAVQQLKLHLGVFDKALRRMTLEDGFVTSLRPYNGLHEKNFHLVMEALLTVGDRISRNAQIDRDLIRVIWSICMYARAWGLHPKGMLQKNKLIATTDIARLELWVDTIEQTCLELLAGKSPSTVVYHYASYVVAVGWWDNIGYFLPLMQQAISDPDIGSGITMLLAAVGKLGVLAKPVLPTLKELLRQEYSWNHPEAETPTNQERTTSAVRADIEAAITAIESCKKEG